MLNATKSFAHSSSPFELQHYHFILLVVVPNYEIQEEIDYEKDIDPSIHELPAFRRIDSKPDLDSTRNQCV